MRCSKMKTKSLYLSACCLAALWTASARLNLQASSPQQSAPDSVLAQHRAVLDKYCVTCHNQRAKTAGLALDGMDLSKVSGHAESWERVVRKLRTGAMPPAGMPRPEKPLATSLVSWLETELDRAALERPNPGRPTLHRLNRAEYRNAIRDLLALRIDPASLL